MISLRIATYATFLAVASASAMLLPDTAVSQQSARDLSGEYQRRDAAGSGTIRLTRASGNSYRGDVHARNGACTRDLVELVGSFNNGALAFEIPVSAQDLCSIILTPSANGIRVTEDGACSGVRDPACSFAGSYTGSGSAAAGATATKSKATGQPPAGVASPGQAPTSSAWMHGPGFAYVRSTTVPDAILMVECDALEGEQAMVGLGFMATKNGRKLAQLVFGSAESTAGLNTTVNTSSAAGTRSFRTDPTSGSYGGSMVSIDGRDVAVQHSAGGVSAADLALLARAGEIEVVARIMGITCPAAGSAAAINSMSCAQ